MYDLLHTSDSRTPFTEHLATRVVRRITTRFNLQRNTTMFCDKLQENVTRITRPLARVVTCSSDCFIALFALFKIGQM